MKVHDERRVRAHRNGGSVTVVLPRWFAAPGDTVIVRREGGDKLSLRRDKTPATVGDLLARMRELGGAPLTRPPQPAPQRRKRIQ
jgi:virulence-associated protein VagC